MTTALHDLQEELNEIKIQIRVEQKIMRKKKSDLKDLKIKNLREAKKVYKQTNKEINKISEKMNRLTKRAEEILCDIEEGAE